MGDQPSPVHNAGDLTFGPDGYLYIPLGDGGPDPYVATNVPGDPLNNAQRRDTMLGSILRIDVDENGLTGADCGESGYTIPPGNPFTNVNGCDEIWATGLRNPWRIDFDPANGALYVADVGEWRREEINVLPAGVGSGANFGWHCYEGTVDYKATWDPDQFAGYFKDCGPRENYVFPAFEYDHSQGECSLTGGMVYRGENYPFFSGNYLYTDFCTGRIWALSQAYNGDWQSRTSRPNLYSHHDVRPRCPRRTVRGHARSQRPDRWRCHVVQACREVSSLFEQQLVSGSARPARLRSPGAFRLG